MFIEARRKSKLQPEEPHVALIAHDTMRGFVGGASFCVQRVVNSESLCFLVFGYARAWRAHLLGP